MPFTEEESRFYIVEVVAKIEGTLLLLSGQNLAHELLKELDLTLKAAAHFSLSEQQNCLSGW